MLPILTAILGSQGWQSAPATSPLILHKPQKAKGSAKQGEAASTREKLLQSGSKENGACRTGWKLAPVQGI